MKHALLGLVLAACGGETLNVGGDDTHVVYDDTQLGLHPDAPVDVEALRARCAAPSSNPIAPTSGASPQQQLDETAQFVLQRWYACGPVPAALPSAFELAPNHVAYELRDQGDRVFVRGEPEAYSSAFDLRNSWVLLNYHGGRVPSFERTPMRMSLEDSDGSYLFVAF
jgi:hypothetical protein